MSAGFVPIVRFQCIRCDSFMTGVSATIGSTVRCSECGLEMFDVAERENRSELPPIPANWRWNDCRGARGMWELEVSGGSESASRAD